MVTYGRFGKKPTKQKKKSKERKGSSSKDGNDVGGMDVCMKKICRLTMGQEVQRFYFHLTHKIRIPGGHVRKK